MPATYGKLAIWVLSVLFMQAVPAREDLEKARASLVKFLETIPGAIAGRINPLNHSEVHALLSQHLFVVRFRGYPIRPPDTFALSNLFVVDPQEKVLRVRDEKMLTDFLRQHLQPVRSEHETKNVLKLWLRLAQEFHQDGYLEFGVKNESLTASFQQGRRVVTGKAQVSSGGEGYLTAKLTFDEKGSLLEATSHSKITSRGARPAGVR